ELPCRRRCRLRTCSWIARPSKSLFAAKVSRYPGKSSNCSSSWPAIRGKPCHASSSSKISGAMILRGTSGPWMCISTDCANGSRKTAIPSRSEPSRGLATAWSSVNEDEVHRRSYLSCSHSHHPPDCSFFGHVFLNGSRLQERGPIRGPFRGSAYQLATGSIFRLPNFVRPGLFFRVEEGIKAQGDVWPDYRGAGENCERGLQC